MVDKKNAPAVPNPVDTAFYQSKSNLGNTKMNAALSNTGTVTPYGTTSYEKSGVKKYKDPYTGKTYKMPTYNEVVKLSDSEQAQFDLQQQTETNFLNLANDLSGKLGSYLSTPFSLGEFDFGADLGVGAYTPGASLEGDVYAGDPLKLGNEATEARLFELGSKRLDPKFAQQRAATQASLLSRGIREGTAAWDSAMKNFNEGENDAYNSLLLSGRDQAARETQAEWQAGLTGQGQTFAQKLAARGMGMAEQGQQWDQTMADRQRLLQERGQQTGEAFATRSQPINEIMALLGGGQVTVPDLTNKSQVQNPYTDTAGIINNSWEQQFKAWQAESAASQGMLGGLFGAVGNIFASDRRIKDNVDPVGKTESGLPIYEFTIGDGPTQTGVLAQDVEDVNPDAVIETPSGIKAVDYAAAVGDGTGTYTVEKGDNLWDIGKRFGVPVQDIVAANQIANPDRIMPGDQLTIPGLAAPGPEAIPYDPLSSAFVPPEGGGIEAVAEALQPANDVDMMTQTDASGAYLMPPNVGGARPEFGAGGMPAAPRSGDVSATMGGPPMPPAQQGFDDAAFDAERSFLDSRWNAWEMGRNREEMERFQPPYRAPPQSPAPPPPPAPGTVGAGSTGGEFFSPAPPMPQPADATMADRFMDAAGPASSVPDIFRLGDINIDSFPQPEPRVGTVDAGSTGGEFFTPPPPQGGDPLAGRVSQAFDVPAGQAEIMDLLSAFQNRMRPPMGMQPPMAAGMFGGF